MIAAVWVLLAGSLGGGMYGTGRILARDDMPLLRQTRRQQLVDLYDGVCGLFAVAGMALRSVLPRPGSHARS